MLNNQQGFTLIELILVLTLVSIVTATAMAPKFINIQQQAYEAQRDSTAASVHNGLQNVFSDAVLNDTGAYPVNLDTAPAGACVLQGDLDDMCFSSTLQMGVSRDWNKNNGTTYLHTPTGSIYSYTQASGTFLCTNC